MGEVDLAITVLSLFISQASTIIISTGLLVLPAVLRPDLAQDAMRPRQPKRDDGEMELVVVRLNISLH